jgi:hypothetical protein
MKETVKQLAKIDKKIANVIVEIENINTSIYYNKFGSETERKSDLTLRLVDLENLKKLKFITLSRLLKEVQHEIYSI